MLKLKQKPEPRCLTKDGQLYVGVTSAMKLVKQLLNEPDDYVGINAYDLNMHCLEGSAAHAVCLDWLAYQHGMLPEHTTPEWPAYSHNDEKRWYTVMSEALQGFQDFVTLYDVEPIAIEQESYSKIYSLMGHLDLYCLMSWNQKRIKVVLDLKFVAALLESHRLQVRCYSRLDAFKEAQLGMLYQGNRTTGKWQLEPVNLTEGLADVAAVANAARLWAWAEGKKL